MNLDKLLLLRNELADFEKAAEHLRYSLERTRGLFPERTWDPEKLERLEVHASRFSRLSDLLTQRIMRLVDDLELTPTNTLLDRIHRAEKRGWVESAERLVRLRELRKRISSGSSVNFHHHTIMNQIAKATLQSAWWRRWSNRRGCDATPDNETWRPPAVGAALAAMRREAQRANARQAHTVSPLRTAARIAAKAASTAGRLFHVNRTLFALVVGQGESAWRSGHPLSQRWNEVPKGKGFIRDLATFASASASEIPPNGHGRMAAPENEPRRRSGFSREAPAGAKVGRVARASVSPWQPAGASRTRSAPTAGRLFHVDPSLEKGGGARYHRDTTTMVQAISLCRSRWPHTQTGHHALSSSWSCRMLQ